MRSRKKVKCPFCSNGENLDWETDPNYFDPDYKEYETKEIVICPKCKKEFSVFLRYREINENFIKDTDEIQYLRDEAFKLVNVDICKDPNQQ